MDQIDYTNSKVIEVIKKAELKGLAQKSCIEQIDLLAINKNNLGEAKYNYEKCMQENGFGRTDYTMRNSTIGRY